MNAADENRAVIARFYAAFAARDGSTMAATYGADARFEDPVFGRLTGSEVGAMWRMLTSRPGSDLRIELPHYEADDTSGTAHWIVRYTFARTGNQVVNDIHSRFRLHDGLVIEQVDRFSFWQWSRQAFGLVGLLVGWTPFLRTAVRRKAKADLASFMTGGAEARPA